MNEIVLFLDLDGFSTVKRSEIRQAVVQAAPQVRVGEVTTQNNRSLSAEVVSAIAASVSAFVSGIAIVLQVMQGLDKAELSESEVREIVDAELKARLAGPAPLNSRLLHAGEDGVDGMHVVLREGDLRYEVEVQGAGEYFVVVGRLYEGPNPPEEGNQSS